MCVFARLSFCLLGCLSTPVSLSVSLPQQQACNNILTVNTTAHPSAATFQLQVQDSCAGLFNIPLPPAPILVILGCIHPQYFLLNPGIIDQYSLTLLTWTRINIQSFYDRMNVANARRKYYDNHLCFSYNANKSKNCSLP